MDVWRIEEHELVRCSTDECAVFEKDFRRLAQSSMGYTAVLIEHTDMIYKWCVGRCNLEENYVIRLDNKFWYGVCYHKPPREFTFDDFIQHNPVKAIINGNWFGIFQYMVEFDA